MSPVLVLKQAANAGLARVGKREEAGGLRTSVPRAGDLPVCAEDALDERRAVMRTLGADGLDLSAGVEQQHLGVEALDLDLLLVAGLQVQRGDPLELELLCCHSACRRRDWAGKMGW